MLRICRVTLALACFAAVPAFAQTTSDQQTPPYSKDVTKTTTTTTTTQSKDPTVVVQPAPTVTVQPAPPPPAQTITVQPATPPPPNVTIVPPAQPVVEQRPVSVNVIPPERPEPMMAVSLGGGISEFREDAIRERTGVNGEYEARLLFGVTSPLAFEAAYVGTAVGLQGLSGENSATLLSNGIEGLARLNLGHFNVQPFVVGGAGWSHYSVIDKSVTLSDVRDNSDVLTLPFGGGVSSIIPDTGFMVDARFIYRATFEDDLMKPTVNNSSGAGLGNWNISLRLGYAF